MDHLQRDGDLDQLLAAFDGVGGHGLVVRLGGSSTDLSKDPAQVVSPAWHGDVLRSRREQVQQGNASFQSWNDAIEGLRAELAG
jgi:hypothetical protein